MPDKLERLVSLETEKDGPPSEIQIIPFGRHETTKGAFELDEDGMQAIVNDFNSQSNDMVIDYEHQSLEGAEAPAAGWIKGLVGKGRDGLWAAVEWTERAKQYLRNREYRYLSPVFLRRATDGKVMKLINAALTNQPAIYGMVPVVNKDSHPHPASPLKGEEMVPPPHGSRAMRESNKQKNLEKEERSMKRILELLGLKPDATEDEAVAAVTAMKQGHEQSCILAGKVAELESRLRRKHANDLVAVAMKQGKVTPATRDWAMAYAEGDPDGFMAFAAKAPVMVPMGEMGGFSADMDSGAPHGLQTEVNRALGIDEGTFRKHNKD